ncbi:universal stress protein [Mycobacterium cookii]|uniref:Universal stress protein n=1 Tax=Mycobacterium cookii TaxID=1775 RepID=A0A7I7KVE7_9MYCO|nr:universal stress protein [Mycobacterium cookii]MCV7329985.1 universal stress protein [Mycobacterium cookii]BBX45913.1 universal stress protein [Mycobacterium cookii]
MLEPFPPKSVVVGIDGSHAALRAALWAVDEVAGTDIPLRLIYIREPGSADGCAGARAAMEAAEQAVHDAYDAINKAGKPVKVEMEIIEGYPLSALMQASESTPLLCVGDTGSGQASPAGFGSTATALMRSAHCSVAVVRGGHSDAPVRGRSVVAHVVGSVDDELVLERAFEEAHRRHAPLVVMTAWRSEFDNLQNDRVLREEERLMRAVLDRYAALWTPHYPDVTVDTVVAYGPFLNYLTDHAESAQLVVIGATQGIEVQQLSSPTADRALGRSDFAVLIAR